MSLENELYCFNPMYPYPIEEYGIVYPSILNYYVAKQFLPTDKIYGEFVRYYLTKIPPKSILLYLEHLKTNSPLVIREKFKEYKYDIMEHALRLRFKNNEEKEKLLATNDILLELNMNLEDFGTLNDGNNIYGKLLMILRKEFKRFNH